MIELSITSWAEAQNLVKSLRNQVFVIEQKVPEDMEWDELIRLPGMRLLQQIIKQLEQGD
jgi:exonuclease VII small subunit